MSQQIQSRSAASLCLHLLALRLSDVTHVKTNLFGGGWTVVDKHQRGEDIGDQANDGDEVGGDPGRDSSHQPFPVTLHQRLQQGASRAAVPAGDTSQEQAQQSVLSRRLFQNKSYNFVLFSPNY